MTSPLEPTTGLLRQFDVHSPVFAAQSGIATVWKVQQNNGQPAALKCYHNDNLQDEGPGFLLLDALNGHGAVHLYAIKGSTVLLEWLDGPSLGDLTRAGKDNEANDQLVRTASNIHSAAIPAPAGLPNLADWFTALAQCTPPSSWSAQTIHLMQRARDVATFRLAKQTDIRPLHGDLHHDNIKQGTRGFIAFDAKGVIGDRAYELANGFKNPRAAAETVQNPARTKHLAQSWGKAFGTTPTVLLDWACACCALSYAWHIKDGQRPDTTMLKLLFDARDGTA